MDVDQQTVEFFVNGVKAHPQPIQINVTHGVGWVPFVTTCTASVRFTALRNFADGSDRGLNPSLRDSALWSSTALDEIDQRRDRGAFLAHECRERWEQVKGCLIEGKEEALRLSVAQNCRPSHLECAELLDSIRPAESSSAATAVKNILAKRDMLITMKSDDLEEVHQGLWFNDVLRQQESLKARETLRAELATLSNEMERMLLSKESVEKALASEGLKVDGAHDLSVAHSVTQERRRLEALRASELLKMEVASKRLLEMQLVSASQQSWVARDSAALRETTAALESLLFRFFQPLGHKKLQVLAKKGRKNARKGSV